jgi:hypothetical protein
MSRCGEAMIRFSCVYCGQRLRGPERFARKRTRCPACHHLIRVQPDQAAGCPASSDAPADGESAQDSVATAEPFWEGMTDEEILGYAREKTQMADQRREREAQRRKWVAQRYVSLTCARYDDLTLFTLSLALLLLVTLNIELWGDLTLLLRVEDIAAVAIVAGIGMVLAVVNIALGRERSEEQKQVMLAFAVLVPAATGVYAGWIVLKDCPRWQMIFPAWNILGGAGLAFEWFAGVVTTDSITGERPTPVQFLTTTVSTVLLLLLCQYIFKLHWAISFSVTVCYALSLQGVIREYFPSTRDTTWKRS